MKRGIAGRAMSLLISAGALAACTGADANKDTNPIAGVYADPASHGSGGVASPTTLRNLEARDDPEFAELVKKTYAFHPADLTDAEKKEKFEALDQLWDRVDRD